VRQVGTFVVPPRSSARLERDVALNNTPITPEEAANIQDDCTLVNTIHPPRHAFLAKKVEASGLGWEKGPVPSQPPSPDS